MLWTFKRVVRLAAFSAVQLALFSSSVTAVDVARIIGVMAANDDNRPARNATNGSGMSGDLHDSTHANTWLTKVGTNGGGDLNPHPGTYNPGPGAWTWIKFEFDRIYSLDELQIWNYNEWTVRGLRRVVIEYTTDRSNWDELGHYTFARAPFNGIGHGLDNYSHNTTIDFGGVAAKSVIITSYEGVGVGNWGDGFPLYGLSEVRFISDPNPDALEQPLESGRFERAMRFGPDRPFHWVEAPIRPEYSQLPLTVESWVQIDSKLADSPIVALGQADSVEHWRLFAAAGTGDFACLVPGKVPSEVSSGRDIADGQWHYVAMVLEQSRVRLAVDGDVLADVSLTDALGIPVNIGPLTFGAYPPDALAMDGLLDEVRVSSGARVVDNMPTSRFVADGSTVGLWRFDRYLDEAGDNMEETVKFDDFSATSNDGLIEPPPLFPLPYSPPAANLRLELGRGISLDRQYRQMPVEAIMTILSVDIFLIKKMGFEFVKLIVNPALHKAGDGLNLPNMPYLDTIVNTVRNHDLPVVVTIHPEHPFKLQILGSPGEFEDLLGFYEAFAAYMAARWGPEELVFQLMTEPAGNYTDWNVMQTRMWQAVRNGMPDHTLILSGDDAASIPALTGLTPVEDENVIYCFEFYEPWIFSIQGAPWTTNYSGIARLYPFFFCVPYPSSPAAVAAALPSILANVPAANRTEAQAALEAYGSQGWDQDRLADNLQPALDWRDSYGGELQLFVGEWGVLAPDIGGVDPEDRYAFIQDVRELFQANDVDWAIWSYNETLTVLDPTVRVPFSKAPKLSWIDTQMRDALFGSTPETVTIAGTIETAGGTPVEGVLVVGSDGVSTSTDALGQYSLIVKSGWSGMVTATLEEYTFTPVSRQYTGILADRSDQDYEASPVNVDARFEFGFEMSSPCGSEIPAVAGGDVLITGHATLTAREVGVSGLTQSAVISSPDGAEFCIDVSTIQNCTLTPCKADLFDPYPVLDLFGGPTAFIIQNSDAGCMNGSGDPDSPTNLGRRGFVDSTIFQIGTELPVGTYRTLPVQLTVTAPDSGSRTIVLRHEDGLAALSEQVSNAVSFNNGTIRKSSGDLLCVPCTLTITTGAGGRIPGDAIGDNNVDISDNLFVLTHLFLGGSVLPCEGSAASSPGAGDLALLDWNVDDAIDLTDPITSLTWLFLGTSPAHALGSQCVAIAGCEPTCGAGE